MGPFNPNDGDNFYGVNEKKSKLFKVICKGISGDDGNLYRMYVSKNKETNVAVEGGNSFTYEYSFRMKAGKGSQAYIFPFIDDYTRAIKQYNFDFDGDGAIRLYTSEKKGLLLATSGDGSWASNQILISPKERNKTAEIIFQKKGNWYNDITFYLLNQYDKTIPFYTLPIGSRPLKNQKITIEHQ